MRREQEDEKTKNTIQLPELIIKEEPFDEDEEMIEEYRMTEIVINMRKKRAAKIPMSALMEVIQADIRDGSDF